MKRKNIKLVVKEYFLENPSTKIRVRQLERILKVPLPSIIRYCKELEEEGILKTTIIGEVKFYTPNNSSEKYVIEKKFYNIRKIYDSGLINFLKKEFYNPTIILFGSYFRGEDKEDSDIDIFIETKIQKKVDLKKYEKILGKKINLIQYKSIKTIKNKHLANNILNGLVLNGFLNVF